MLVEGPNQLKSKLEELRATKKRYRPTFEIVGEEILYYQPFLLLLLLYQTSFRSSYEPILQSLAFRFKRSTSVIHKVYARDAFTRSCIQSRHV